MSRWRVPNNKRGMEIPAYLSSVDNSGSRRRIDSEGCGGGTKEIHGDGRELLVFVREIQQKIVSHPPGRGVAFREHCAYA
jgi:hypothetical protein